MISARCIEARSSKPGYPGSSSPRSLRSLRKASTSSCSFSYMAQSLPIFFPLAVFPASNRRIITGRRGKNHGPVDRGKHPSRTVGLAMMAAVTVLAVGGCGSEEPAEVPTVRGAAARSKPFVGSSLRAPYHRSDCQWAKKIAEDHLIGYDSADDAELDGRRPCRICRPYERRKGPL